MGTKVKILGPQTGITDILEYVTEEKIKQDAELAKTGEKRYNPLRPSAAGKCSRELALELLGYRGLKYYPKPLITPEVYRIFSLGHSVEYDILKHFKLLPFEIRYKQQQLEMFRIKRKDKKAKPEFLEGSCDFVLWSDNCRGIGDIKSKKAKYSSYRNSSWEEDFEKYNAFASTEQISPTSLWIEDLEKFLVELGEDFLADNFWQLNAYANSKFIKDRGIDFATLIYYNKATSQLYELRFKPNKVVYKQLEAKFNRISLMVDEEKVPDQCDFTPGTIRYAFCGCHQMLEPGTEDPRKLWFSTFPPKAWPKPVKELPKEVQESLEEWVKIETATIAKQSLEDRIVAQLLKAKVKKVKMSQTDIFELKFLKSPKEHYELRRCKA